jgi:lysophospholipase L1-like esterase
VGEVSRSGDELFKARLNPAGGAAGGAPRYVQMTGLGYPYVGSMDGHRYAGPEVDHQWELQNNEYEVSLKFTGTRLGLAVLSAGGQWRARVDGAAVGGPAPRSVGSSSAYHVLDLDFSRAGPARSRTITFQLSGGAWLSGVGTDAGSDVVSAPAVPRGARPSVYWLGDSYVAGGGARHPGFDDLVHVASQQAGLGNVTIDALGGTGYLKTNPVAKFPDYLARAKKNLRAGRAAPDLIIVGGSINDGIYTTQQVRSAASRLFAYLARAVPKSKVVVVPFTDGYPIGTPVQHSIDGVLAAARAAPNVVGVLNLPAQVLAQRGNTSVAALGSRLYSTTVKYHPSPAGHKLFGEIIGRFLARIVAQRHSAGS